MIIVDTNVVSEIGKRAPNPAVVEWMDLHADDPLFTTAISVAEILSGIALMPVGRHRAELADGTARLLSSFFEDRILPFDASAAAEYGDIIASRNRAGRPPKPLDCQIAAIARVHDATIVTRNVKDFTHLGLLVVDPWHA